MTKRTTDQWKKLLDGTTPAPWRWQWDRGILAITGTNGEAVAIDADIKDSDVLAAAPEAVVEVVRLRRELEELRDTMAHNATKIGHDRNEQVEFETHGQVAKDLTRILEGDNDE